MAATIGARAVPPRTLIEIDSGEERGGVHPESDLLLELGGRLGSCLTGVMTHAGGSYAFNTPEALQAIAEQERSLCVAAAQALRAAGHICPTVSVGSTPTALSAQHLRGVTEERAGVYIFFDLVIANIGVCTTDEIAISVLCSVAARSDEPAAKYSSYQRISRMSCRPTSAVAARGVSKWMASRTSVTSETITLAPARTSKSAIATPSERAT